MNPFDSLLWQARALRQRLSASRTQSTDPGGRAILDLGISSLVPYGYRGTARGFLGRASTAARRRSDEQAHREVDQLVSEARSLAGRLSILTAKLDRAGNSYRLVGKFGPALDSGSPVSRVAKLERALDFVSKLEVIENRDIPGLLKSKAYVLTSERVLGEHPELKLLQAADSASTEVEAKRGSVGQLPLPQTVTEPFAGARRSLELGGPDAYRQGLNSLRVALDAFIEARGGKGAWNLVGKQLARSDEEWKVLAAYHHVLSMGSHHGRDHTEAELQIALELFGPACKLLMRSEPSSMTSQEEP